MAFEFDLLEPRVVTRLISEVKSSENMDRKVATFNSMRIAKGDVKPYVLREVQEMLPQSWKEMRISDISISHKVVNKLAQAYKEGPVRKLENDTESEMLNDLYAKININKTMDGFDEIRTLNRYALLWVNFDPDIGLQFANLHPYEFDVIRNSNNGSLEVVILQYPDRLITHQGPSNESTTGRGFDGFNVRADALNQAISNSQLDSASDTQTFVMWTARQHIIVQAKFIDADGKISTDPVSVDYIPIETNPFNINPLGVLPFIYSSTDDGGNFTDYPIPNPLTGQSILFNILNSDLLSAASIQGYGIRTISGTPEMLAKIEKLHEGLTTAAKIPQSTNPGDPETKLEFVNPSPDLAGQRETYASYLSGVLSQHGINSASVLKDGGQSFTSGLDRALANSDVTNIIQQNQNDFSGVEKRAFEIVKLWAQVHDLGVKFSEDSELQIHFPRPKILISDRETLENIQLRLDMGLIDKVEALMILNPNLTEEEARDKIESIKDEKLAAQQTFMGNMQAGADKDDADESDQMQGMLTNLRAANGSQ